MVCRFQFFHLTVRPFVFKYCMCFNPRYKIGDGLRAYVSTKGTVLRNQIAHGKQTKPRCCFVFFFFNMSFLTHFRPQTSDSELNKPGQGRYKQSDTATGKVSLHFFHWLIPNSTPQSHKHKQTFRAVIASNGDKVHIGQGFWSEQTVCNLSSL